MMKVLFLSDLEMDRIEELLDDDDYDLEAALAVMGIDIEVYRAAGQLSQRPWVGGWQRKERMMKVLFGGGGDEGEEPLGVGGGVQGD